MNTDPDPDGNYVQQVAHWRRDVYGEYDDTYDTLLAKGCAPRLAAATLRYLAGAMKHRTPRTQTWVAEKYGTSPVTLRSWADIAWKDLPDTEGERPRSEGGSSFFKMEP